MTGPEHARPELDAEAGIDEIQQDIEHTRQELGDTVHALSHKLDVKGRVQNKAVDAKDHVVERASHAVHAVTDERHGVRSVVPAIAALAVVAGVLVWRRRRAGR
ncbi:DUF3618 domain-containing protein [Mycobacterium sp. BMJ-28]